MQTEGRGICDVRGGGFRTPSHVCGQDVGRHADLRGVEACGREGVGARCASPWEPRDASRMRHGGVLARCDRGNRASREWGMCGEGSEGIWVRMKLSKNSEDTMYRGRHTPTPSKTSE
uniref:Uncharacterized protein n=1 Tax=Cannabis sativa TaxID=3483 RepID=A0A803PKF6_CANSA